LNFLEKLLVIDRRIIFLFVGVAIALPLFFKANLKVDITPEVRKIYDIVENLPEGSKVLIAFDYDPGSMPELQPMAESFIRHCIRRKLKMIIMGLWPQGFIQANLALEKVLKEEEFKDVKLQEGVDWVNLGYAAGNEVVIERMGSDISAVFAADYRGIKLGNLPLMKGVKNFSNIDFIYNLSAGYPGTQEWVQFAVDKFGAKLGAGNTAVQAPQVYPYYPKQLLGVLGGMKGAAEYEVLMGIPARGVKYMLSQSVAHGVICLFVIIGNLAFFLTRGKRKSGGQK
jgi:hypothetical protein